MIQELQGLRALAMLLIIWSHCGLIGFTPFDAGGDCGVAFFFVLSGLVTWLSQHDRLATGTFSHREYLRRRFSCKLLWLHFGTWLFANILNHQLLPFLHSLPALMLVQSWIPVSDIYFGGNPVSWFLSDLLLAWMLLPLLYKAIQWRGTLPCLLFSYALLAYLLPSEQINAWLYVWPPVRLVDFMLGMGLGRLLNARTDSLRDIQPHWHTELCAIAGLAITVIGLICYDDIDVKIRTAALFWPGVLALLYAACRGARFLSPLRHKWAETAGNWTLPIFMLHVIVLRLIGRALTLLSQ